MLEILNLTTPKGAWLQALGRDWDAALPLAHAVLEVDYGAHEADARAELLGELFRRSPSSVTDAAMLLLLGEEENAKHALRSGLETFFRLAPEWRATIKTPTRRQLLHQLGANVDTHFVDNLSAAELRGWVRQNIRKGMVLPPRRPDDDGAPTTRPPRVLHGTVERAGTRISTVTAVDDRQPPPAASLQSPKLDDPDHPRRQRHQAQE